jgi:hypothetical protein
LLVGIDRVPYQFMDLNFLGHKNSTMYFSLNINSIQ